MAVKNWSMIESQLVEIADKFLQEAYQMRMHIPVKMNGRLKRVNGWFIYKDSGMAIRIEIAKDLVNYYTWEEVVDVLKHECIHYALFKQNLPNDDGHPYFEAELKKHGVSSTHTLHYKGMMNRYKCRSCDNTFDRVRRLPRDGDGYTTGCCGDYLISQGKVLV